MNFIVKTDKVGKWNLTKNQRCEVPKRVLTIKRTLKGDQSSFQEEEEEEEMRINGRK